MGVSEQAGMTEGEEGGNFRHTGEEEDNKEEEEIGNAGGAKDRLAVVG